jgi:hypothetical protein
MLGTNGVMALLPGIEKKEQALTITTTPIYLESLKESTTLLCKIITAGHSAS